jgi:hypothetical protein
MNRRLSNKFLHSSHHHHQLDIIQCIIKFNIVRWILKYPKKSEADRIDQHHLLEMPTNLRRTT